MSDAHRSPLAFAARAAAATAVAATAVVAVVATHRRVTANAANITADAATAAAAVKAVSASRSAVTTLTTTAADASASGPPSAAGSDSAEQQKRSRFRARQAAERVVCCPSPGEYLATIRAVVGRGDRVLVIGRRAGGAAESASIQCAAEAAGGGAGRVVRYAGALWDIRAMQALGDDFAVVCVEVGDVFGNDVVCDGQSLVRLVRSVFGGAGGRGLLRHVVVKSRSLAVRSRTFLNAHRVTAGLLEERTAAGMDWSGVGKIGAAGVEVPLVIAAVGVRDYRNVIPHVVLPGDTVLEIGCALGKTTHLLSVVGTGPSGRVIGIDTGRRCIRDAEAQHDVRRRKALQEAAAAAAAATANANTKLAVAAAAAVVAEPTRKTSREGEGGGGNERECAGGATGAGRCEFVVADAWDTAGLLQLSPFFNSIFVDVGGISGSDGELEALALVRQLVCAFGRRRGAERLRAVVVKSRCLRDHANAWWHSDDYRHANTAPPPATATTAKPMASGGGSVETGGAGAATAAHVAECQ